VITGAQIRAARALLRWTSGRLGRRSNVQQGNIVKAESVDDVPDIPGADLQAIKTTLESAGVEFIGGVGVKLCPLSTGETERRK
jgi:hypothetical protein